MPHLAPKIALTLALAALASAVPRASHACGGEWVPILRPEVDYRKQGVPLAEKALDEGRPFEAAAAILRMMPHVRTLDPKSARIVERAERVLAVAVARGGGALPVAAEVPEWALAGFDGRTQVERDANLAWSVATLETIARMHDGDTAIETDLAEAMSTVDARKAEARDRLEKLAARDLVATGEAYEALARLRRESGDAAGGELALLRCASMSRSPAACRRRG